MPFIGPENLARQQALMVAAMDFPQARIGAVSVRVERQCAPHDRHRLGRAAKRAGNEIETSRIVDYPRQLFSIGRGLSPADTIQRHIEMALETGLHVPVRLPVAQDVDGQAITHAPLTFYMTG